MIGILGDELQSLKNPYDCAAAYIPDNETFTIDKKSLANDDPLDDADIKIIPHSQASSHSFSLPSQGSKGSGSGKNSFISQVTNVSSSQEKLITQKIMQEAEEHRLRIEALAEERQRKIEKHELRKREHALLESEHELRTQIL